MEEVGEVAVEEVALEAAFEPALGRGDMTVGAKCFANSSRSETIITTPSAVAQSTRN